MVEGRVVGVSIVPREAGWFMETYVVTSPGRVVVVREPYSLPVEPPRFEPLMEDSEATRDVSVDGIRWRTGVEEWEKPLVAAAMYMVDARPEEEVFKDMVELVGGEMADRIASLVWRIVFGEGYSLDEWADLLESLKILSPWEPIWRFQELVERGLRKKHTAEPADLEDREVLRAACKLMSTG